MDTKTLQNRINGCYTKVLQFAGHCYRSNIHCKQFVSDLLFYETEPLTKGKFIRCKARLLTYDQLLLKDTDFYIHDFKAAMLNKDEWRQLINKLK